MAERRRARFKVLNDADSGAGSAEAEGATAALSPVAATLRKARVASGQNVREVAALLCIRRTYLQAIEEGRFADLPGPTYAIGFVRTFADYLGLDAEEIVRRFKDEVARAGGLDNRTDLTFPEPVAEGRAPTAPLLLVAAVLAVAVYGGWYYYTTRDQVAVERVPEPPAASGESAVSSTAAPAPATPREPAPTEKPADAAEAVTAKTEQETTESIEAAETTETSPAPIDRPEASAPPELSPVAAEAGTDAPTETPAPAPVTATGPAPVSIPAETATAPTQTREEEAPAPTSERAADAPAPTSERAVDAPAPTSERAADAPAPTSERVEIVPSTGEEKRVPVVYGPSESRITLRALSDSWIQIREAGGALLDTLVLHEGDAYRVPDVSGLTLMTGNAGALEVTVDGAPAPPIGTAGKVRRDVPLDPVALKAGRDAAE